MVETGVIIKEMVIVTTYVPHGKLREYCEFTGRPPQHPFPEQRARQATRSDGELECRCWLIFEWYLSFTMFVTIVLFARSCWHCLSEITHTFTKGEPLSAFCGDSANTSIEVPSWTISPTT